MDAAAVVFGPFRLEPDNARLWRGREALRVSPKALAVLHYLVEHAGQLVTKEELFTAVWPGVVVGDAALTICIGELRKVLGEKAKTPRYIETVHKRATAGEEAGGSSDVSRYLQLVH
jgi:DNA-binding winged helix-turn-helix (wHTH) protein